MCVCVKEREKLLVNMSGCESDYILFIIKINKNDLPTLFDKETAFLKPYFPGHVIKKQK